MARPRKVTTPPSPSFIGGATTNLVSWAESFGEAVGRGVARGINTGLSATGTPTWGLGVSSLGGAITGVRRRGRPPKAFTGGIVPEDRRCRMAGCPRPARSKGLCSAHYQAERRRLLARGAKA